jgi:hypothetical protein
MLANEIWWNKPIFYKKQVHKILLFAKEANDNPRGKLRWKGNL